jgi:hypothetical protein
MIKRIFQDLDECILHVQVNKQPNQEHHEFTLHEDPNTYYAMFRPCAKELFAYYNELVGKENVYILTAATFEYAEAVNRLGEFGLDSNHIFAREHTQIQALREIQEAIDNGNTSIVAHELADKNNVLIDNLPWKYNTTKMNFMGIHVDHYHQTPQYYGVNFPEDLFLEDIKGFLKNKIV